jgi:hypothetical protein
MHACLLLVCLSQSVCVTVCVCACVCLHPLLKEKVPNHAARPAGIPGRQLAQLVQRCLTDPTVEDVDILGSLRVRSPYPAQNAKGRQRQ